MASGQVSSKELGEGLSQTYRVAEPVCLIRSSKQIPNAYPSRNISTTSAAGDTFVVRSTAFPFW